MAEWFPLPIFPENSLSNSVTTTVFVGVWVVAFFNLRFGWTLSGLIVPGYLVPLLVAKPVSAGVIVAESVVTYLIVHALFERLGRGRLFSGVFGRDRFFAIVLVSVLVRLLMEQWLLPKLGDVMPTLYDQLYSYGLIVVPLTANYFWKPGLRRGLPAMALAVGVTYLIVRFVLVELTNFRFSGLHYMYEDIAGSLLASPKAYVLLLTTAWLASWMNLAYGWEYGGILIPALLALQWYDPVKVLSSLVEAGFIVAAAGPLLKTPLLRRMTVEGARQLLVFFSIGYGYRMALGFAVPELFPDLKISDTFGYGYLLSTLLAMKAFQKHSVIRVLTGTVRVSLAGGFVGCLIGFALTLLPELPAPVPRSPAGDARNSESERRTLVHSVLADKLMLYRQRLPGTWQSPHPRDLAESGHGFRLLRRFVRDGRQADLQAARRHLLSAGFVVSLLEDRYLYVREQQPARGWGLFAIDLRSPHELLVSVPAPVEEPRSLEAGLNLFRQLEARALAVAGSPRDAAADGSSNALINRNLVFGRFHRLFGRESTLMVRCYTGESPAGRHGSITANRLWVKRALPGGLNLKKLQEAVAGFRVEWRPAPLANRLRDAAWSGFAELFLDRQRALELHAGLVRPLVEDRGSKIASVRSQGSQVRSQGSAVRGQQSGDRGSRIADRGSRDGGGREHSSLIPHPSSRIQPDDGQRTTDNGQRPSDHSPLTTQHSARLTGRLAEWLLENKEFIAREKSEQYRPAAVEEMLRLDEEVLTPLVDLARRSISLADLSNRDRNRLLAAAFAARTLDMRLTAFTDRRSGAEFLILHDPRSGVSRVGCAHQSGAVQRTMVDTAHPASPRHWGTFVVRVGRPVETILEVPRPLAELNVYEFAVTLFESSGAEALLITGAHLRANADASADVLQLPNRVCAYHLARQVLLREYDGEPLLLVQLRGATRTDEIDAVLAPGELVRTVEQLPPLTRRLAGRLRSELRLRYLLATGSPQTVGYEVSNALRAVMLNQPETTEVAQLWLSAELRRLYRPAPEDSLQEAQFLALGIPTVRQRLTKFVDRLMVHVLDRPKDVTPSLPQPPSPSSSVPTTVRAVPAPSIRDAGRAGPAGVPPGLRAEIERYLAGRDIVVLRRLQNEWPDWSMTRVVDADSRQPVLVLVPNRRTKVRGQESGVWRQGAGDRGQGSGVRSKESDTQHSTLNSQPGDHSPLTTHHSSVILVNLTELVEESPAEMRLENLTAEDIERFLDTRTRWLIISGTVN